MSEFDEKLNALLANPDSMAKIMQLAQSLSGNSEPTPQSAPTQPQTAQQPQQPPTQEPPQAQPVFHAQPISQSPPSQSSTADLLSSLTGGIDPKLIARLLPLLKELGGDQDTHASQLLYALRPYLKSERQDKVERALQLARLVHLGKKFLSGWEG